MGFVVLAVWGLYTGSVKNWRISMTIVAALLVISVGCYLFGVLYSPWGRDFRTENQPAAASPADEVTASACIVV